MGQALERNTRAERSISRLGSAYCAATNARCSLRRVRRRRQRTISEGWRWLSRLPQRHKPFKRGGEPWTTHSPPLYPNQKETRSMVEATQSVHLAKIRATLHHATITLALQAAMKITKHQLRAQGSKPMYMPHRELRVRAEAYLTAHREELIAEAKEVVEPLYELHLGHAFQRSLLSANVEPSACQRVYRSSSGSPHTRLHECKRASVTK